MQKVACGFCRLPFAVPKVRPGVDYFCCSGCALASRIPWGEGGRFPVSVGLVVALVFAFGLFNQGLFGVLGAAVAAEGRVELGGRLASVSLLLGGGLALAGALFGLWSSGRSVGDVLVAPIVLLSAAWFGWVGWRMSPELVVWPAIAVNAVLAFWLGRGWCWRAYALWRGLR